MSESGAQIQNLMERNRKGKKRNVLRVLKKKRRALRSPMKPKIKSPMKPKKTTYPGFVSSGSVKYSSKSRKNKKTSVIKKIKKFRNKAMNTAADLVGATSAVKVGGNLIQNLKSKKTIPLYKKGDYKSLAKDVTGIVTLGAASLGAVKGLAGGAKAAASKAKILKGGYKPSVTKASQRASQNKFLQKYGLKKMRYR